MERISSPFVTSFLHQRIMRRIALVVIVVYAVGGIFIAFDLQRRERAENQQIAQFALVEIHDDIETRLANLVTDTLDVANSITLEAYAINLRQSLDRGETIPDLSSDALRLLDDLVALSQGDILAARFISTTGQVTGEIIHDGENSLNNPLPESPNVAEIVAYFNGDEENVQNVLLNQGSNAALDIYAPVRLTSAGTDILGVLQVVVAVQVFTDIVSDAMDDALINQNGRQIAVIDNLGNIITADNAPTITNAIDTVLTQSPETEVFSIGFGLRLYAAVIDGYGGAGVPWRVLVLDDATALFSVLAFTIIGIILLDSIIIAAMLFLIHLLLRPVIAPVAQVGSMAKQLASGGEIQHALPGTQPMMPTDEVGELHGAIYRIATQVDTLKRDLDTQVQRYSRDMDVVARIGRETAILHDIGLLLTQAINLICDEFGFYHGQVYLIDDVKVNAVLAYSRGQAGEQLLANNHKLRIGSNSVVGQVVANRHPIIVNDTELAQAQGIPHRPNPLLPETRAEMGLPLIINREVIGVLDIQSKRPNAFTQNDLPTFRLLADQLAVAIHNARLVNAAHKQIEEINFLNRQLTRETWTEHVNLTAIERQYQYNLLDIDVVDTAELLSVGNGGPRNHYDAAINLRGEIIGQLSVVSDEDQELSDGDRLIMQSVVDRVSLAIENTRLIQETQGSLAEKSMLYDLSRALNNASQIEEVVRAILDVVMQGATAAQVWVFDEYHTGQIPEWMELKSDVRRNQPQSADDLTGMRIHLEDYPALHTLGENKVMMIPDIQKATHFRDQLAHVFEVVDAGAAVLIPLNVRGNWRGVITFEFAEPREFNDYERRLYDTLVDQAGVAIDNRLLLQQTEDDAARNQNLYAASRIINTAQSMQELVYAAVVTANDQSFEYSLSLVEGPLDDHGWAKTFRMVARSEHGDVVEVDYVYNIEFPADSPIARREPHIVKDDDPANTQVPEIVRWVRDQGYRFAAIFPLYSVNRLIALFQITSKQLRQLSESEYEAYRALTGQMSSQIQIRLEQESTARALEETRRLYLTSNALATASQAEEVYQVAVEHLAGPFSKVYRMGSTRPILKIDFMVAAPEPRSDAPFLIYGNSWHIERGMQTDRIGRRVRSADYPYGQLVPSQSTPMYIENLQTFLGEPDDAEVAAAAMMFLEQLLDESVMSLVIAPVSSRNRWFGVIVCMSDQLQGFSEDYVRFVSTIADQVGTTLDGIRALEQSQIERDRAQTETNRALVLADIAQIANRVEYRTERSFENVLERPVQQAGFDRWALAFWDEATKTLSAISGRVPGFDMQKWVYTFTETNQEAGIPFVDALIANKNLLVNEVHTYPKNPNYAGFINACGKHIVTPIRNLGNATGVLMVGRDVVLDDLDDGDEQFAGALAAQIAAIRENRDLIDTIQQEQQTLQSILTTLPTGVLVLDAETLVPLEFNERAEEYLGREIDPQVPFNLEHYNLYRTGTQVPYPQDELPIFTALHTRTLQSSEDVAVVTKNGHIDLLMNAAPIRDSRRNMSSIVVTLEDISNIRNLENALQESLRETTMLYDMQRDLADIPELDDVLDVIVQKLTEVYPDDAYILFRDELGQVSTVRYLEKALDKPEVFHEVLSFDGLVSMNNLDRSLRISEKLRSHMVELGISSLMTTPLRGSGQADVIGWLMVVSTEAHRFMPPQQSLFNRLTDVASTAITNRTLIQQLRVAVNEQENLYNTNTAISRARDIQQLASVLEAALLAFAPGYAGAFLDHNPGLRLENLELFAYVDQNKPSVDFEGLFIDYPLPEDGLFVEDIQAMPKPDTVHNLLLGQGVRAFGAVHLRMRDRSNGFLIVAFAHQHFFSMGEKRYIRMIVDSAANVFNNAILLEQVRENLDETSVLYQASKAISEASRPDQIVDVVVTHLIPDPANQVFVALLNTSPWDEGSTTIEIVASWRELDGIDLNGITLTEEQFPAWRLLVDTHDVMTISDIYHDEALSDIERIGVESLDARSLAIIPLRAGREILGIIWISSRDVYQFNDRDIRKYQAFAEQASLSLQAAFYLDQEKRRAKQLETSLQVSQDAAKLLDLDELLPNVVNLIKRSFEYDHVQVFLMDKAHENAVLRASTGEAGRQLLGVKHSLPKGSNSVIGQVTLKGEPQIALDTADANVIHLPNAFLPLTRSEMALPLIAQGRVVGALDVQSNEPNAFNMEDITSLTTLAAQLSVAVDNALLYEDARERAAQNEFLFAITTAAASAETLQASLNNIASSLEQRLRGLAVAIYLRQKYEDTSGNTFVTYKLEAVAGTRKRLEDFEEVRGDDTTHLFTTIQDTQRPIVVDNITLQPRYRSIVPETLSAVLLPLNTTEGLEGIISIERGVVNGFSGDEVAFLRTLANSLSSVVRSFLLLEELQRTAERLLEVDRLKNEFLANMSHELRTPLNSIIGFSKVILRKIDGPLTEMQEQDLNTIHTSGQHLLSLINEILDQAKISAGKMDLKTDYFEIRPLIEVVRSIGIGLLKDKPVSLTIEIAPNLPLAYGDEFRTRQVLINIVSNAAKFTEQGYIIIRAYEVHNPQTGQHMIRVDVEDTGIGIPEKDRKSIFEAFQQVDSSLTKTHAGTGLGLPIAKSLIELQGGELSFESIINEGSIFSVTIPTEGDEANAVDDDARFTDEYEVVGRLPYEDNTPDVKSDTAEIEQAHTTKPTIEIRAVMEQVQQFQAAPSEPEIKTVPSPPMRSSSRPKVTTTTSRVIPASRDILLIEDSKEMVDQFRRALQREGYIIQTADHPAYTEAMAGNIRPLVIIMDVNFANGEGWNVLKRLKDRDDTFDIPIVIVTLSNEAQRAYQLGAFGFIQRPFIPEDLIAMVKQAEMESKRERILIIDDQPDDIRLLTSVLEESGTYRIFSAQNGADGISLIARRRPDLVLLDLRMPEMDGFAILHELRSNPETANIPVMIVTGEVDFNADEQSQLEGVYVVPKSIITEDEYDQFIADVRRHLEEE